MKLPLAFVALALIPTASDAAAADKGDPLCTPLREFVASVGPGQTRLLAFHTSWGKNFKTADEPALFAKDCLHHGYKPAKAACLALMEHGMVEFSNLNAQRAIVCLAPDVDFGEHAKLEVGSFSINYGNEERGSLVTLSYGEDAEMGGMVLRVAADGY